MANLPPADVSVNVDVRKLLNHNAGLMSRTGAPPGDNARVDASRGLVAVSAQAATDAAATPATKVLIIPRIWHHFVEENELLRAPAFDDRNELEDMISRYLAPADRRGCDYYHRLMSTS